MGGRILLQWLLVAVALGASYAQVNTRPFVPARRNWRQRPECYRGFHPSCFYQDNSRGGIAFPGDPGFPVEAVNRFVETVPVVRANQRPGCTLTSIDPSAPCEEDQEYNLNIRNLVSRLLARTRSINEIVSDPGLRVILNDTLTPSPPPSGVEPATRFGGPRESPACHSREELIFPQRAKTPKNDWVFVVNQEGVRQALRVERCHKEGDSCNIGIPNTGDVSTVCRQKYVYRRMLVVGSNQIEPEEVLMPSCCVCYVRRNTFDISSRTGNGSDTTASEGPVAQPGGVTHSAPHQPSHHQPQPQPSGNPIGFLPSEHVNHNIRRSSGGYSFYHPLYHNNGGR